MGRVENKTWFGTVPAWKPGLYLAALAVATLAVLLGFGRPLWCGVGDVALSAWDVGSAHLSQHLVDPYSFTHIEHGLIFFAILYLAFPKKSLGWRFLVAITLAAGWEILENSSWIIDKYREQTVDAGYYGDSVFNALSDMACCAFGFWFAARFRLWWSVALLLIFEVTLAITIRDNLFLNLLMLSFPVDAVFEWQKARGSGG